MPQRLRHLLLCWLAAWAVQAAAAGTVVAVGGALRDDNHAVWGRIVELAGGAGARFVVLATASGEPELAAAAIVSQLQRHGAVATVIPVAPMIAGIDIDAAVRSPRWLAQVQQARGVFFSGGAQARLVDTLQPGGVATPLLLALRELFDAGGVVAGTSSGAAVMSALMFRDAPDLLAALRQPLRDGVEVDRGFGFLPPGVVVDQHFVRRGRIGRLLPLLVSRGLPLGIGVEEDSAVVVRGSAVDVIGARGAVVVDLVEARHTAGAFNVQGARLHWLASGDGYDLAARQVRVAAGSRPPCSGGADAAMFYPDILGAGVFAGAMTALVAGPQAEARGLAFDLSDAPGFEWRLYKAADTRGITTVAGDDCSVLNLRLDVSAVRLARPLYMPIPTPP